MWTTWARPTSSTTAMVPPGEEEKARLAAANCPEFAIVVEE